MDNLLFLSLSKCGITPFIIIPFLILLYVLPRRDSRHVKFLKGLPGPPNLPFIGSALPLIFIPPYAWLKLCYPLRKYFGSLFAVWVGNRGFVLCCGAKEVEAILSSTTQVTKGEEYELLNKWLGHGLLTAKSERWRPMRKLLAPAFHFKNLERFFPVFNEQVDGLISILKKRNDGQPFDMCRYTKRCALNIICETAMGIKLDSEQMGSADEEYIKAFEEYGGMVISRSTRPWLLNDTLWRFLGYAAKEERYVKILHSFTSKVIADKKRDRLSLGERDVVRQDEENPFQKTPKVFLDLLLDLAEEHNLSDITVREETDTFMLAGHDTVAANLIFTIMNLSQFPEHQKIVQDELDEIFGGQKNVEITPNHVSRMNYLECCVKETLRLYPSVPFYFRQLTEDLRIGDRIIPQGVSVFVHAYFLHRDAEAFPDPEAFKPDRFLVHEGSTGTGRHPYAYVPFSAGPRNCPGQKFANLELKVVLAKLFLNFNFTPADKLKDIKMVPDITLRPLNGVNVSITPRY